MKYPTIRTPRHTFVLAIAKRHGSWLTLRPQHLGIEDGNEVYGFGPFTVAVFHKHVPS